MDLILVKCPSCGGDLTVTQTSGMIFCNYCGNKFELPKSTNQSPTLNNFLSLAKTAEEVKSYEDALNNYNKVLEIDPNNYEAWIGKGYCIFFRTTLANPNLNEMIGFFKKAYEVAPQDKKDLVSYETKEKALIACKSFFYVANAHYREWKGKLIDIGALNSNRDEYVGWCLMIENSIDEMLNISEESGVGTMGLAEYGLYVFNHCDNIFNFSYSVAKRQAYLEKIKEKNPNYQPPAGVASGCFIATATMGDYDHPNVISLRQFRDKHLINSPLGRKFVDFYYKTSPFFANIIAKSSVLQFISRWLLVKPLVAFSEWMNK